MIVKNMQQQQSINLLSQDNSTQVSNRQIIYDWVAAVGLIIIKHGSLLNVDKTGMDWVGLRGKCACVRFCLRRQAEEG